MKLVCSHCGGVDTLPDRIEDADARAAVEAALKLPAPLAERLLRYLCLFRPKRQAMRWERVAKLLRELLAPVQAARVTRHGRDWPAPQEYWIEALDRILAKTDLELPLTTHGFLIKIVADLAEKAEAKGEQQSLRPREGARMGAMVPVVQLDETGAPERTRPARRSGPPPGWKEQAIKRGGGHGNGGAEGAGPIG